MPSSKKYREQLATLIEKGREVIDKAEEEKRDLTAEDREQIDNVHVDAAELQEHIRTLEKQETIEAELGRMQDADAALMASAGSAVQQHRNNGDEAENLDQTRSLALSAWFLKQARMTDLVTEEHSAALQEYAIDPYDSVIECKLPCFYDEPVGFGIEKRSERIMNALSVGSDTGGGFTVPQGFVAALEIALLQFGGMRAVSTIQRTATGEALPHPTTDDTGNIGKLIAENVDVGTAGVDVKFGSIVLNAYEYTSDFVRVSNQLIRDTALNLAAILGRLLGERLGRIQNQHFTTGDGAAKPKGIVTSAATGITAASATALAADELLRLIHSVDPAYRGSPGVAMMMHDTIMLEVSLLKDGNGNYLLRPGLEAGSPATIRGFRVQNNQDMASALATGNKIILFGDFSKYMIREVGTMRLERVRERFIEFNQTAFIGFMSFDGALLDAGTNPVKLLVMA